jgi:hypothetical protein
MQGEAIKTFATEVRRDTSMGDAAGSHAPPVLAGLRGAQRAEAHHRAQRGSGWGRSRYQRGRLRGLLGWSWTRQQDVTKGGSRRRRPLATRLREGGILPALGLGPPRWQEGAGFWGRRRGGGGGARRLGESSGGGCRARNGRRRGVGGGRSAVRGAGSGSHRFRVYKHSTAT